MSEKKPRYDEGCLMVHALNHVADRWALLVIRELMFGPKRFQAIRAGMPGITAAVLTTRLRQLIDDGLVASDPVLGSYGLAAPGEGLLPVMQAYCRWALGLPGHDPRRFISPCSLMISATVCFDRDCAAGRTTRAGFDFGSESFTASLSPSGDLLIAASRPTGGDFVLRGSGNTLAAALYSGKPLTVLRTERGIGIDGDEAAAQDFVDLFSLEARPA